MDETLDGDITDVEYTTDDRLTDDDIRQYLRGHWHLEHPTDLQKKENSVWRTIAATIKADRYQLRSHTKNKWQNESGSVEPSP